YIFMFRGQGRKRRAAEKMVQGLKKNDRIQTMGGSSGLWLPPRVTKSWFAWMSPATPR
ncbi:MAG: preprotein translocase subunit YajC, partial [Planctomycetes bacterium]|nr:preprotein translocase subunit YajC [Planctomycetota bacterium]